MSRENRSHSGSYSPHKGADREYRHHSHHKSRSKSPESDYKRSSNRDRDKKERERDRDRDRRHLRRRRSRSHSRESISGDYRTRSHRDDSPFAALPFQAKQLTKYDLEQYFDLFAEYLEVQKDLAVEDLDKVELKGRFKSFIGHWNRGELAKGWYDPSRRKKKRNNSPPVLQRKKIEERPQQDEDQGETSSEEDIVGPVLPGHEPSGKKSGVTLPTIEDLNLQKELAQEDAEFAREQLRNARKLDRKLQRERLEELAPRADPGSKERRLEKKKELNEKLRSFRENSPGAALEVSEDVLMGGGSDGFKALKTAKERKKNERELRKEAMLRQRIEEREARLQRHRAKEEKTVMMLKAMAENSMYVKKQNHF